MTSEETTSRLVAIQQLLETSAGGNASAYTGLPLWSYSRDQLLTASLAGLPLVSLDTAKKTCCSGAKAPPQSALVLGLRGAPPFDGSQFPRLPWGQPPLAKKDIELIEQWIAVPPAEALRYE